MPWEESGHHQWGVYQDEHSIDRWLSRSPTWGKTAQIQAQGEWYFQVTCALDLDDKDILQTTANAVIFNSSIKLKQTLEKSATAVTAHTKSPNNWEVKLPKINVPTFNGNILFWISFWEHFSAAVHSCTDLSQSKKLVYLHHSVKGGLATHVIEGLSCTSDHYIEAVECFQAKYDRAQLIHQSPVKKILDMTFQHSNKVEIGSWATYIILYNNTSVPLIKSMGYEPSGPFFTSVLELKLDTKTMFE